MILIPSTPAEGRIDFSIIEMLHCCIQHLHLKHTASQILLMMLICAHRMYYKLHLFILIAYKTYIYIFTQFHMRKLQLIFSFLFLIQTSQHGFV